MFNTFNIGHIPPHRLAFNNYRAGIHLAGGEIGSGSAVQEFIEWRIEHNLFGCVVAPWAGVLLDTGVVSESFSMLPYSGNTFFNPSQGTAGSRPTQSGLTWNFDGVDDWLDVDLSDLPMSLTVFSMFESDFSAAEVVVGQITSSNSTRRFAIGPTSSSGGRVYLQISTGSSAPTIGSVNVSPARAIGIVEDGNQELYINDVLDQSGSQALNPSGTTVLSIGRYDDGNYFSNSITGATGIITSVLTPQQKTELNSLL